MAGEGKPVAGEAGLRLHHLRPAPGAHKARTRVGRGEASKGKTAGLAGRRLSLACHLSPPPRR